VKGAATTSYDISGDTAATVARANKIVARYIGPSTFGELQEAVTAICQRPENSLIQIGDALEVFTMQLLGKPQNEIDNMLNRLRQVAIKFQDSDKPDK